MQLKLEMKTRKIRNKRLFVSGLIYRCFIVICNALFFATGLKPALEKFGVLGASLCWNSINMCLYFLYHFIFAKLFKLGKD